MTKFWINLKVGAVLVFLTTYAITGVSQVVYNNGLGIYAKEGAIFFVDGTVQNQSGIIEVEENAGNNAEMIIQQDFVNNSVAGGNGYYRVLGDWINNNTFNAGTGTVFLEGANQFLDGSVSTYFNNLTLDGSGLKTQTINQYCTGILDLKHIELQNDVYGFFVTNTNVNAIIRTTGFVSALDGGFLSRQTNSSSTYLFPVGSSVGTLRYRPVELTPENATANTYTVRMANVLATTEGYDVNAIPPKICEVNPEFYHQINQTVGTAAVELDVFYNETEDGSWDGLANWTSPPDLWSLILSSVITPGVPFNEAIIPTWSNFAELPYILYRVLPEATISDPGAFCENDAALDLTSADAGGTWSGTGITNTTNGTFDPTVASLGINTITYTIGSGTCINSDQIDINVNPIPNATITNPGDFCSSDATVNLSAATAGGTWSGTGITNAANGTFDPASANIGANNVTYEVTVAGCTGTDNITIQVNALPNVNTGADLAVCEGEDISLTETGGDATIWNWTGPGAYSAGIQNPTIISASAADAGTYTVEVEDANGCIATDDVAVSVNPNPVAPTVSVDCSGGVDAGIITVTSPIGANYEYSLDGITFQSGTNFGPLTNGTYTITVQQQPGACTTTGSSINLDCGCANPTNLTLSSLSASTCVETAHTVSGNTFGGSATEVNVSHDGDGSLNALNFTTSPFELIYTPAITDAGNTVNITVTTDNPLGAPCSVAQETFTLTVRSIPLVNAGSNSPVCDGTDIELSETGGAANTWTWTGPGTFSPDANAQNPDINNATAADAGIYSVIVTDAFGCTATDNVTVVINSSPAVNAGADFSVCEGDDINLNETGGDATIWTWTGPGTFTPDANSQNPVVGNATAANAGTYNVEIEDVNGCIATDDVTVTVNASPDATITDPGDFCTNDAAVNLTAATLGGTWTGDGITDGINGTFDPASANIGANNVTYTHTVAGCTGTDNITIQVNTLPNVDAGADFSVCEGDDINLTETGGDAILWTWTGPGTFTPNANTQNPVVGNAIIANTGTYNVEIEDINGCIATDDVTVTVNATPDATITDPGDFCSDDAALDLAAATTGGNWTGDGITNATNGTFDPSAAIIGANNISYEVTVAGCTGTDNITIDVFDTPDATITDPGDFCSNDAAINLSAVSTGGTWSGTGITDVTNGTFDPTSVTPGTYTITYNVGTGTCSDSDQIDITVNLTPTATITNPGDFCSDDAAVNLTAATAGGTWTGTGITDATNGTFDPASANIGVNNITYEVTVAGCTGTDNITIDVFDTPEATITDPGAFCSTDAAIDLTAASTGGTWSGIGITDASNGTFNPATAGAGTHTITYNVGTGTCSDSDQIDITVNLTPNATITNPGDFCSDDAAVNLTAATAGGTWTGTGITDATNGTFDPASANIGVNNITYEVTVAGCTGTDNITIEVFDTPDATITDPGAFCSTDAAIDLTAASTGGTWSGIGITDASNGTFNPATAGAGTHTITYNVGTGTCSDSDQIDIIVNLTPNATITDPGDFCSDDAAVNLTAATAGGTWTGTGITNTTNGTFDPASANIGANNITYEVSVAGCTGTDNISINVFDTPDATITNPGAFCSTDAAIDLTAVSTGGTWSGTGITDAANGTFNPATAGAGTHTITYNVGTGTCSDSDQIDITVNLTPNATITNPGGFCNTDDAISLIALPLGGSWSGIGIINTADGVFDPQAAGAGSFVITYTVSENGCNGNDQVTINVDAAPDVTIKPIGPICYDNIIIELEAETEGGMWSGPGVSTSGNFNVAQAGVGVHEIVYEFGGNCGGIGTLEVEIFPSDINTDYVVSSPLCLSGNDGAIELITSGGTAPYTYEWGEDGHSETGNISGLSSGEYTITVIDSNGCFIEIDEIIIEDGKNDCIFIPNAFTPNEDGINDEWVITNIEAFSDYMVKVFNRWGQEVYVGYVGSQPWDGFYESKPLPTGAYVYIVEIKDIEKEFVGVVTLIR